MKKEQKQENCFICHKKLTIWNTPAKKQQGPKVCSSCLLKKAKKDFDLAMTQVKTAQEEKNNNLKNTADKLNSLGKKLTVGLTFPIILFVIGLFTFPIGIIFWILGVLIFTGTFVKTKK